MTDRKLERIDEENEELSENIDDGDTEVNNETETESTRTVIAITPVSAAVEEVQPTPSETVKVCAVCSEPIHNNFRSIQPCPCGYWVHPRCLVSGIQRYEAKHPGCAPLGCKYCLTRFNIYPRKNPVVKIFEKISVIYGRFIDFGFCALVAVLVDSTFTVIGMAAIEKIYGRNATAEMLLSMAPTKAVAVCKSIPLVSIGINCIPWENKLLKSLRRCSRLPLIGWMFPRMDPRVREEKQKRTLFGVLMGGLLLPWHANVFGVVLFGTVQSKLHRHLLGGVAYLGVKGVLNMYYRQKLYARQCLLNVEAYSEQ